MTRPKLIRSEIHPYHITMRTNNKAWFDLPLADVWNICLESFSKAHEKYPVNLISFVLMSNHYHLLMTTPEANIDSFMYEFNKKISNDIRERTNRINKVFGSRYKWCLIQSNKYFSNCYRYVYQNPIRAGLSHRCESYSYSTLWYLVKNYNFPVAIHDKFGHKDLFTLKWLNSPVSVKELEAIRKGLRSSSLEVLKDRDSRKPLSSHMTHCSYQKYRGTF